ncbi:Wzz/FepE/Etk N-terminal domain-containing protein [Phenylobacterium koreense]|uniref:Uncharacterized protein involved in exopolysaccharide biosynthesis n=1 Tax=Phenylobacterium koreense TaxID=266125 RepID=A0ABV2EME9_9CAUL
MSIFQFLRILWAHRYITLATTVCTLIGAFIAILIVPPSYQAVSRVMLNTLKPDPVTGEVISSVSSRTYVTTQTELIRDYEVAGKAVDQLGWASNPDAITRYQSANANGLEFRQWLAKKIIDQTSVKVVTGTNILEIAYKANSPSEAKSMADALRNAYIESTLDTRRTEAARTADWYALQAQKEQALLNAADAAKTQYERENGIVMQADNVDIDTARLRALASQSTTPAPVVAAMPASSPSGAQLAQLDAAIAQATQTLGPNHPQMQELRARRASVAAMAAQEAAAARAMAGASSGALQREVAAQTSKVIANRDKIERLSQLQAEVNLRRDQYNKSMARIVELRQEAAVADTGLTPLGQAVTPQKPLFPNKPLILGGSLGLGFGLGIVLSLLLELFGRRVRSAEDMLAGVDAPLLAVISLPGVDQAGGQRHGGGWLGMSRLKKKAGRQKLARA